MSKEKLFNLINENIGEINLFTSKQASLMNTTTTSLIYDGFVMYKIFFNRFKEKINSNNPEIRESDIANGIMNFPRNLYPKNIFEDLQTLSFSDFINIFNELFKFNNINININELFIHNTNLYNKSIVSTQELKMNFFTFINRKTDEKNLLAYIDTLFPYFRDNSSSPNKIISSVILNDRDNDIIFVDSMASLFVQLLKDDYKKIATTKLGYAEKKFLGMLFKTEIYFFDFNDSKKSSESFSDVVLDNMFTSTSDSVQFENAINFFESYKSKVSPIFETYNKFDGIEGDDLRCVMLLNNVSLKPQIIEGKKTLKEIVDKNYLEAIIQLPVGFVKHPMSIWILNRNKKSDKTLLIADSYFNKTRFQLRRDGLDIEDIDKIKEIIFNFRNEKNIEINDSLVIVNKGDIVNNNYVLLPALYLKTASISIDNINDNDISNYVDSFLEIVEDRETIELENKVVKMIKELKKMNPNK